MKWHVLLCFYKYRDFVVARLFIFDIVNNRVMTYYCVDENLSGFTNSEGKFIIDTKNKTSTSKEEKYRSVDEVEIWVVYFNKKRQDQTSNKFSNLSAEIECVIDDDATNRAVVRTTFYKVNKTNLSQQYDSDNVQPGRYLLGNYNLYKEALPHLYY